MNDPVQIGAQWHLFYEQENGLKDMLASIRNEYLERMAHVEPWETDKLSKLAIASRIVSLIDGHVQSIIGDGKTTAHNREHIRKIESLPTAKRKWI